MDPILVVLHLNARRNDTNFSAGQVEMAIYYYGLYNLFSIYDIPRNVE